MYSNHLHKGDLDQATHGSPKPQTAITQASTLPDAPNLVRPGPTAKAGFWGDKNLRVRGLAYIDDFSPSIYFFNFLH